VLYWAFLFFLVFGFCYAATQLSIIESQIYQVFLSFFLSVDFMKKFWKSEKNANFKFLRFSEFRKI